VCSGASLFGSQVSSPCKCLLLLSQGRRIEEQREGKTER